MAHTQNPALIHKTAQRRDWIDFRPFVVQRIVAEAPDVKSSCLVPEVGLALPVYQPGQCVMLTGSIQPRTVFRSTGLLIRSLLLPKALAAA